jgi:[ribosomal protein S18]-alanine N-acetyltransferase
MVPMTHPIRLAEGTDLDALVTLEEACFTVPWSRKSFEAELFGNQFSRLFVVPHPEEQESACPIIAYVCCWLVFDELRFLNLAVAEKFRRQGLAKALIEKAIAHAIEEGCGRGLLEVRESNHHARNLYQSFNFKVYANRKGYYTNPDEDAILMALDPIASSRLPGTSSPQERNLNPT